MIFNVVVVFGSTFTGFVFFRNSENQGAIFLLSLILVGYFVGFCETHRAKFWGFILFSVNLYLWIKEFWGD